MLNTLVTSALSVSLLLTPVNGGDFAVAGQAGQLVQDYRLMASESIDLNSRYPVPGVSEGFKENILIALGYLSLQGEALQQGDALQARNGFYLVLGTGEVFAFHKKGILPEFKESKIISQESDFTTNTGYKVVAGLGGNGVCHLASLMNLAAAKAGLEVTAPTSHNFAPIPGIDKKYGTSISTRNSPERQNLYIKNSFDFPVGLQFRLNGEMLVFSIVALGVK